MIAHLLLLLFLAGTDPAASEGWGASAAELDAYHQYDARHFIKARELAEKIVKDDPRSFIGLLVIGAVEHYGEGNLSRALRMMKQARQVFEARHGLSPKPGTPFRWHAEILKELAWISGEIDHRHDEVGYLDAHDAIYAPPLLAERAWPLMKLGKLAEARMMIQLALSSGQQDQVDRALTARCAIEYESQNRQPAFEACNAAAEAERKDPHPGSIPFGNAAEAAMNVLRFDDAEKLLLEATRQRAQGGDNPWTQLAMLHLVEARFSEAGQALQRAIAFRKHRPPYLDQQMRAETESAAASFLIAIGQHQAALRFTGRAMDRPDRGGLKSGMPEIALAGAALVHHSAAVGAAEELREAACAAPLRERLKLLARATRLDLEAFRAGRRAATLLADRDRLVATARPYLGGGALVSTFMVPDLVKLVGPGVAEATIARARAAEKLPEAQPYLDEIAAEAALEQGRAGDALRLARHALDVLPAAEKLLSARAAAIGGEAAEQLGRHADATMLFDQALQRNPGVLRRIRMRLRARITSDGSPIARRAADLLRHSPRLVAGGAGFEVRLQATQACLIGPSGTVLACGTPVTDPKHPRNAEESARALCDAFHRDVFAPKVDMSQVDLTSLDGATATAGGAATDQTRVILRDLR